MRITIAFSLLAACALCPAVALDSSPSRPDPGGKPGCLSQPQPDRLEAITPEGDLVLGNGGSAKLSQLRLPDASAHRDKALDWLKSKAGQPVLVTVQGSRDRWGRMPVQIKISRDSPLDMGHNLVEAGLAMVDAGPDASFCQPELLAFEETARERHLGLWADGRYNPIPVDQAERLKERVGSFVIVEGRVRSVGERKQRTYLNFGGHWADDFTIIIPRKTWMLMTERGLSAVSLKGRTIRARGILQSWQGTALTVDSPEMIERLEDKHLQAGKP